MGLQSTCGERLVALVAACALSAFAVSVAGVRAVHAICGDAGATPLCAGDCDQMGAVTVDEIVTLVNIALGDAEADSCGVGDTDASGSITVDEIITAVNLALNGCGGGAAPLDPGEECDDGGLCIGGADAGDPCTAEDDCTGDGACFGGLYDLRGCRSNDDCPEGVCRKCRPYGGDGCAANCTLETDTSYLLVPGEIEGTGDSVVFGTSGSVVFGPFLTIPLPLTGSQVVTFGKIVDGKAPVVLKASGVHLDAIPVASVACACVRGIAAMTCGGTLFDADGVASPNCTPGFGGIVECSAEKKCAALHGPGNTGSGFVSCGLGGVDIDYSQDCDAGAGGDPGDPVVIPARSPEPIPADDGSGYIVLSSALGTIVGTCNGTTADYGADGMFCTDDDPIATRGTPGSVPFTTSQASGTIDSDIITGVPPAYVTMGSPFTCTGTTVGVSGANLAGVFTACDQPTVSDIVVTTNFAAQ